MAKQKGLDPILLSVLLTAVVVLGAVFLAGRYPAQPSLNYTGELQKFSGSAELAAFLQAAGGSSTSYATTRGGLALAETDMAGADASTKSSASPSADYSQTNVQVAGVDEADIVKNDGQYIYLVSGGKVLIIEAASLEIKSEISFPADSSYYYSGPREIFVDGDRLAVFVDGMEKSYYFERYDIVPQETYSQLTNLLIYDISDRANPVPIGNYSVSGSYYQSRLVGDYIYFVSAEYANSGRPYPPVVYARGAKIMPDVYHFGIPDESTVFNTITSVDLAGNRLAGSESYLLGYSDTLMVSESNIYIAQRKQTPCYWRFYMCDREEGYQKDRFFSAVVPLLRGELKNKVDAIIAKGGSDDETWQEISGAFSDYFSGIGDSQSDEDKRMLEDILAAMQEYDIRKEIESGGTVIHKIGISAGQIEYRAKGEVTGSLLNQFSMDEGSDGRLRVATTFDYWMGGGQVRFNNVYILGSDMELAGKLENISAGERIYSSRFIGDRLYLVTYRVTDPLFVIDLAGADPAILGELKIPGYSTYLHPYDEGKIIGIGRETEEQSYGRVLNKGVKLALFDVSDVSAPQQVDAVVIGTSETDSAALYEHKAFLFSKEKGLLVIPISATESMTEETGRYGYPIYTYRIWTGAHAYKIGENGFAKLGEVEHSSVTNSYFSWQSPSAVTRSLYIGDTLYTVSEKYLKANSIADGLPAAGSLDLPQSGQEFVPYKGGIAIE